MAKFSRFDPRNKKHGKHKKQSLNKDLRIREDRLYDNDKYNTNRMIKEVMHDDTDWSNTYIEESMGRNSKFS